jgi:hypothetical protein
MRLVNKAGIESASLDARILHVSKNHAAEPLSASGTAAKAYLCLNKLPPFASKYVHLTFRIHE